MREPHTTTSAPGEQDASSKGSLRSRRVILPAILAGSVIAAGGGITAALLADGDPEPSTGERVAVIGGESRLPNTTAEDWVTYADYVVVVAPTSEEPVGKSSSETSTDGGLELRSMALDVQQVLWTSKAARQPAPEKLELLVPGWVTADGGQRVKATMQDAPRVELHHTYIVAISYVEARCSPGDEPEPAHFEPLGENAYVPFDDGLVGQGEVAGRSVTAGEAAAMAKKLPQGLRSVADDVAGRPADALVEELDAATPGRRIEYTKPAPCD